MTLQNLISRINVYPTPPLPQGEQLADIFESAPRVAPKYLQRWVLQEVCQCKDLSKANKRHAARWYGYFLLIDGRRHLPEQRKAVREFFGKHPVAKLFVDGGVIEKLYQQCEDWMEWCQQDQEYLRHLEECWTPYGKSVQDEAIQRALQHFDFFKNAPMFCSVLSVVPWQKSVRYPHLLREGILHRFALREGSSSDLVTGSEVGESFRKMLAIVARRVKLWWPMERLENIVDDGLEIVGYSGGLAVRLAQELASQQRRVPPFIGISVAISEKGEAADINGKTVAQKITLAVESGMRLLFLPESVKEVVEKLPAHKQLLEIRYIPKKEIYEEAAGDRVLEEIERFDEIFSLSQTELLSRFNQAFELCEKVDKPTDFDCLRALRIFQVVAQQTRNQEENDVDMKLLHLRALLGMLRIFNHQGEAQKARAKGKYIYAKLEQYKQEEAWTHAMFRVSYDLQSCLSIPDMDEFNYPDALSWFNILIDKTEKDKIQEKGLLGAIHGGLGQLYMFWMEKDARYQKQSFENLKKSYHYIKQGKRNHLPRQLNYLINYFAICGDVPGAQEYLKEWQSIPATKKDVRDCLFFLLYQLRLFLAASRKSLHEKENAAYYLAQGYELVGEKELYWLEKNNREHFWMVGNIYRHFGGICGELGKKEQARDSLQQGMICFENRISNIVKGQGNELFFPMYSALWAEAALLNMDENWQEKPREVIKRVLDNCQVPTRRAYFEEFVNQPLDRARLLRLTQIVHY